MKFNTCIDVNKKNYIHTKIRKKQRNALVTDFPFVIFCGSIKIKMLVNNKKIKKQHNINIFMINNLNIN